jgi:hypothetical protein
LVLVLVEYKFMDSKVTLPKRVALGNVMTP